MDPGFRRGAKVLEQRDFFMEPGLWERNHQDQIQIPHNTLPQLSDAANINGPQRWGNGPMSEKWLVTKHQMRFLQKNQEHVHAKLFFLYETSHMSLVVEIVHPVVCSFQWDYWWADSPLLTYWSGDDHGRFSFKPAIVWGKSWAVYAKYRWIIMGYQWTWWAIIKGLPWDFYGLHEMTMNNMISLCGHLTELANRTSPFLLQGKQSPFMGASSINIVSHAILPRKRCGYPCCPRCIQIIIWLSTLWEFNIAMEKTQFSLGKLTKNGIVQ